MNSADHILDLAHERGVLRPKDLTPLGISRHYLAELVRQGLLDRIGRGLYVAADAEISEFHTRAAAARRIPHGVLCLLSALRFHDLTTQNPSRVWMAIDNKARRPRPHEIPLEVVWMSGKAFEYGIDVYEIDGVDVRLFSPAKTVADCFKFRNRIGLDVAIEALRDYRADPRFDMDRMWSAAKICRVSNVMRPYLQMLA